MYRAEAALASIGFAYTALSGPRARLYFALILLVALASALLVTKVIFMVKIPELPLPLTGMWLRLFISLVLWMGTFALLVLFWRMLFQ